MSTAWKEAQEYLHRRLCCLNVQISKVFERLTVIMFVPISVSICSWCPKGMRLTEANYDQYNLI